MQQGIKHSVSLTIVVFLSLVLSACGGSSSQQPDNDQQTRPVTVRFEVPTALSNQPEVDVDDLSPQVSIDGVIVNGFQRLADGSWSRVKIDVRFDALVNFEILWQGTYSNRPLELGSVMEKVNVPADATVVVVDQSDFASKIDTDDDGVDNLSEVVQGSNPFEKDSQQTATSLNVEIRLPDVEYSGTLRMDVDWNGNTIAMANEGLLYKGRLLGLTPSNGSLRVSLESFDENGNRMTVYTYDRDEYRVNVGENNLRLDENDFKAWPLGLSVSAKIPDRDYRRSYTVTLFNLTDGTSRDMSVRDGLASETLDNLSRGEKLVAVEIRNASNNVLWARAEKRFTIKVGANKGYFDQGDFSFDYDSDGDGILNINDPQPDIAARVDVEIPFAYNGAPRIDGMGDEAAWNAATEYDLNGNKLAINHLMMESRGAGHVPDNDDDIEEDLQPQHTWSAMYDNDYLYLLVRVRGDLYDSCDSEKAWDDDNLNIYWDGDNSKGSVYDGKNDFHLMLPMFEKGSDRCDEFNFNGRMQNGVNSAGFPTGPDLTYATGLFDRGGEGTFRYTNYYEVRIGLQKAGITVNRKFGIDIHLDDDDDGGSRDQKWGWKHPSRSSVNVDETYKDPSVMGTAILN